MARLFSIRPGQPVPLSSSTAKRARQHITAGWAVRRRPTRRMRIRQWRARRPGRGCCAITQDHSAKKPAVALATAGLFHASGHRAWI